MKTYKRFDKIAIGASDIASLIIVTPRENGNYELATTLHFGGDGAYRAYYCWGDDVEIGDHYRLVATGCVWLKIYDDDGLTLDVRPSDGNRIVDIYRAGEMGCIIHWRPPHNAEEAERFGLPFSYTYLGHTGLGRYIVRDREAGNYIEDFATLGDALATVKVFESEDKEAGSYVADFYEVYDLATETII